MNNNTAFFCQVCNDEWSESKIDMMDHISNEHTLQERLNTLISEDQVPEVMENE